MVYHEKMKWPGCKKIDYLMVKKNKLSNIMMPAGISGDEAQTKRHVFLVCLHCGYIIISK